MVESDCRLAFVEAPEGFPVIQHFCVGYNDKLHEVPSVIIARLSIPVNKILENVA